MPMPCTICCHNEREEIEESVLRGAPLSAIAERHRISKTALWRHKGHIAAGVVKSAEARELASASRLAQQLKMLIADAQRIKQQAERKRDLNTALKAVRELTRLLELAAKLSGEISDRAQTNILNVQLDPDTSLKIAETYLARHRGSVPKTLAQASAQVAEDVEAKGEL